MFEIYSATFAASVALVDSRYAILALNPANASSKSLEFLAILSPRAMSSLRMASKYKKYGFGPYPMLL